MPRPPAAHSAGSLPSAASTASAVAASGASRAAAMAFVVAIGLMSDAAPLDQDRADDEQHRSGGGQAHLTRRHLDRNVVDLARSSVSLRQPVGRDHRVHTDQRYTHLSGSQPCFSAAQTGLRPASSDTRWRTRGPVGEPWNDESHDPVTGTPVAQYDHSPLASPHDPTAREQVAAYSGAAECISRHPRFDSRADLSEVPRTDAQL